MKSEAPDPAAELTPEQFRDVVELCKATTSVEAHWIIDLLMDHGIPAAGTNMQSTFAGMGFANPKIMVPRVLKEKAEATLAAARAEAQRQGVEDAFSEETLRDENPEQSALQKEEQDKTPEN